MRALLQPADTGMCAQVCAAMVANVSLEKAHAAFGNTTLYEEGSHPDDIVRGLAALGVKVGPTIAGYVRKKGKRIPTRHIPKFAIAYICDNRSDWSHAVVIKDGFVYDPAFGWPIPLWVYEQAIIEGLYSRRFKEKRDIRKNVYAYWESFTPILEAPTLNDTVG